MNYLWIAIGGALGSVARHWVNLHCMERMGAAFPWGTLVANISGCFLIGLISGLATLGSRWSPSPGMLLFLMVGVCGGYTTFSSFSLQNLALLQSGAAGKAFANILASVAVGLFAVWVGTLLPPLVARLLKA